MEQNGLGKTNGLANEASDACTSCEMLPFTLLCVMFSHGMGFRCDMSMIDFCGIGVKVVHAKWSEPCVQLSKHCLLSGTYDIGSHDPCSVITGMLSSSWLSVITNVTPHLIDFCRVHFLYDDVNILRIQLMQADMIDVVQL
jgi:hypothetical protein